MTQLTVIIPTYNRAALLQVCIQSLRESGCQDLEIIVVDDGSTDHTEEMIRAIGGNVRYLRQQNQGPATARNYGFRESTGRYVAFVDSDDEWLPGAGNAAIAQLDQHPEVDVVFSDARMGNREEGFSSWIEVAGQEGFQHLACRQTADGLRVLERVPFFRRMAIRNPVFISAVIMRREAFERAGKFDTGLCGAADWELWLRMASQMTFAYWPGPLAIYTRHSDNMSSNHDAMHEEFIEALRRVDHKCDIAAAERQLIAQRLEHFYFNQAWRAYDQGELTVARTRFSRLRTYRGLRASDVPYWILCSLPWPVTKSVRLLKQSFARIRAGL